MWGSAYLEVASPPNIDVTRTCKRNRRRRVAILRVPYLKRLPKQNDLFRRELDESQQKWPVTNLSYKVDLRKG